jgi:hypothetical protein
MLFERGEIVRRIEAKRRRRHAMELRETTTERR